MNKIFDHKFFLASTIIIAFVLGLIGVLFKIMHYYYANEILIIYMFGVILLLGITLFDMIVSPIRKKAIWIITLCFAPLLVGLLHALLRNDMLENRVDYQ